jgi:hypothetical protein
MQRRSVRVTGTAGPAEMAAAAVIVVLAAMAALAPMTATAAAAQVAVPPAHQPVMGAPPAGAGPAAPGGPAAARLVFQLPAAWPSETPSSSMRLAQAKIPGRSGADVGELAIFYFGPGGGGTPEANIERWIGQIDQPAAPPHRGEFSSHGLAVTWVEVAGTMKPSTVGMGPATARPGSRLLGAVVEGPGGPWFVKAIGPDATIAAARPAFLELLHGLRTAAP